MQRLGLDLGSSSIGWALRRDNKLDKKGVITFQSGMVKGQGGYSSPTKDRRAARSKRRLIQARKYRKWALLKELINLGYVPLNDTQLEAWSKYKKGQKQVFPENPMFLKWLACDFTYLENGSKYKNPYELRVKALDTKLSNHEFGRVLYHLIQRRGYKDIGEADKETEKQIERRGESGFDDAIKNNRTLGEALTKEFLNKDKRARDQYPYRDEYEKELELICKTQGHSISKISKNTYEDNIVQSFWDAIIWQRPLRSQKGNIGKCTLEPTKPRCPISHPAYEVYRAWGFINTIKYFDENGIKQSISEEYRNLLFEKLFLKQSGNFKFEEIRRFLDKRFGSQKQYNYPVNRDGIYDTSVAGMPVCNGLIGVLGDIVKQSIDTIHEYNIGNAPKINPDSIRYSIYDLWHVLFEFDKEHLHGFAIHKLGIDNKVTKKGKEFNPFVEIKNDLENGYSDLSLKAICRIIPFLKQGYLYNEATALAKLPSLLGATWDSKKDKVFESFEKANELYKSNKTITGITNNLIDQYKGLDAPTFAFNDFEYKLDLDDLRDIEKACIAFFGENTWANKKNREEIIKQISIAYQAFFRDSKRAYIEVPLLTEIFNDILKENNIELSGELYHHSHKKNIYGKTIIKKGTDIEILPEPRIDSIKNPMFNKSMSILRKLINELIVTGAIDSNTEIVIELARDLNDNNKRIAIEKYQNERRNNREKYREFLNEFKGRERPQINVEEGLSVFELWAEQTFEQTENEKKEEQSNRSHHDILKEREAIKRYELWMEQKGQCMYTGKMISITQLFSNDIDIEHTIPRSILPDNTMANQTVCYAWYNRKIKKTDLPFSCPNYNEDRILEGFETTSISARLNNWIRTRDSWKDKYETKLKPAANEDEDKKNKRIQDKHYYKMHYDYWSDKVQRFEATEVNESWARRQLVDTQMISKYAKDFLKTYFKKVAIQKGIVTADFRKIFNFQEQDEIKSRNKHTHHAIDAAVLTLIPSNSSQRDRMLKKMYEMYENERKQYTESPFTGFNSQEIIRDIENNTFIINYIKDQILKQTYKNIRKRGKLQYVKNTNGEFIYDNKGHKILKTAQGDTIRSVLFQDTFIAKIKDVERDSKGQAIKDGDDWKYKKGRDEFKYVVRKPIKDVLSNIDKIVDPVIKELVSNQKNKPEIKDYQGNIIRHVRIYTKAGQKVKERQNYRSKYEHKNHYYSAAGSLPYAIMLQKSINGEIEREILPIASFELAKMYKNEGAFDIEKYLAIKIANKEIAEDIRTYPEKKLLKVGQKVIVLKNDTEYEQRNEIDFLAKRLYVIKQLDDNVWLKYHLEAQADKDIDAFVKSQKDQLLREVELLYQLPEIAENTDIQDNSDRRDDYEKRRFSFSSYSDFRLKRLENIIGKNKLIEIILHTG